MTYAYILGTYDDHGLNEVVITLDRTKLPSLIKEEWPEDEEAQRVLLELLQQSDEQLAAQPSGWSCAFGWGGPALYVAMIR